MKSCAFLLRRDASSPPRRLRASTHSFFHKYLHLSICHEIHVTAHNMHPDLNSQPANNFPVATPLNNNPGQSHKTGINGWDLTVDLSGKGNRLPYNMQIVRRAFIAYLETRNGRIISWKNLQGGWDGWPTGNGKKVSNSQACCLAQLCLAAA